jgi:protein KRI1
METDTDLLKRFYGDQSQLDATDKFLRNYILLQCWKDKSGGAKSKVQEQIDREDNERDEEMENFEQQYNFRFEEGTGAYLTTHRREVEDTLRRKDDSRKDKRLEKKERLEDEKRRKQEEINRAKQIKRDEILEKIRKAEFVGGSAVSKTVVEKIEKELKTEFIPELYDKVMEKMYDERYYEAEDEEAERAVRAKEIDVKLMKDEELPEEIESSSSSEEGEASEIDQR